MQSLTDIHSLNTKLDIDLSKHEVISENSLRLLSTPYFHSLHITLYQGDATIILSRLNNESVDCIVTSPPYYGKRDYGVKGQLGLEEHPQTYINRLKIGRASCRER